MSCSCPAADAVLAGRRPSPKESPILIRVTNEPRPYPWGSLTAIADFRGFEPSGAPEAELWFGTHPGSPTQVVGADAADVPSTLAEVVVAESDGGGLPFLLKVLAAAKPLSLQAHPTAEQARAGFERENVAGIPVDAPHRNYRDASPKPEILLAVSDPFEVLCGFQDPMMSAAAIRELAKGDELVASLADRVETEPLAEVFEWLITRGSGVDDLVARVTVLAEHGEGPAAETVRMLAAEYPGDPGVVIALLLHRVALRSGEAIFLPAGNIHAYLSGLGVELMTASDNVLRGGLTGKHVDVAELLAVLDFTPGPAPMLAATEVEAGVESFRPAGVDFELIRVSGRAEWVLPARSIVLAVAGDATVHGAGEVLQLEQGQAAYVSVDERATVLVPSGSQVVVAAAR